MTADHLPVWQWGVGSLAVTAVLALTGCTGPATPSAGSTPLGGGAAGTPSTSGPKPRAAKPPSTNRKTADVVADCPVGRWRLRATAPTAGGPVENVSFSGRDAFDLAFDDDDGWRMIGNRKAPLKATVEVAGLPLSGSAAIAGTARGRYRMAKSVAVFRLEAHLGRRRRHLPGRPPDLRHGDPGRRAGAGWRGRSDLPRELADHRGREPHPLPAPRSPLTATSTSSARWSDSGSWGALLPTTRPSRPRSRM